ncbi:hypothetical protein HRH25_21935 [Flavisolibacter sp. BT320]|nr:hypothetical protein [Flavisolibacter longurius]
MLKQRIRTAQVKAALKVNVELIYLYWALDAEILTRRNLSPGVTNGFISFRKILGVDFRR